MLSIRVPITGIIVIRRLLIFILKLFNKMKNYLVCKLFFFNLPVSSSPLHFIEVGVEGHSSLPFSLLSVMVH